MVDSKTKQKLIDEIQKIGIVYLACQKTGIMNCAPFSGHEIKNRFVSF